MSTSGDQISVVLSGGSGNSNQNLSLGGDPSSIPLTSNSLNNLFDNITPEQSVDGHEDYRCIYFFNDGDTTIHAIKIWISEDYAEGSTMELGIENRDESQRLTIAGGICTGGSLELSYSNRPFTINYNSDLAIWAAELETQILALTNIDDEEIFRNVSVTAQTAGASTIIFDIMFSGKDGKRNFDEFEISDNLLEPGTITATVVKTLMGAPINTIAPEINVETTPPGGVGFFAPSAQSPIEIPKLAPTEGFPLWIKRQSDPGITAQERDGFKAKFSAQSMEPV